jgi:hypothetical protein
MIKVRFRINAEDRTKCKANDAMYIFRLAVSDYITNQFKVKHPKLERRTTQGYDDDKKQMYYEIVWLIDDSMPSVKEKIIWIDFVADKVNTCKILNRRRKQREFMQEKAGAK